MATINKALKNLTMDDIEQISNEYLRGWHDLMNYGFRIKGFNSERVLRGLKPLSKEQSDDFRIKYIKSNYTEDVIRTTIETYMLNNRMNDTRWKGIELFNCRFGREYARLFKELLGNHEYRKLSEKCRIQKLTDTQVNLYGGVGLAGELAKLKAQTTASNSKKEFLAKAISELREHQCVLTTFHNSSIFEVFVYAKLLEKFDSSDIIIDYGVHPYDKRYPYPCDFYIKSMDLFIELNVHFTHGGHWFDDTNSADLLRKQHLEQSGKHRNRKFLNTWCDNDVKKRKSAKKSKLNYLVFWDGTTHHRGNTLVPNLKDFYTWCDTYDCNINAFVNDYPNNTY